MAKEGQILVSATQSPAPLPTIYPVTLPTLAMPTFLYGALRTAPFLLYVDVPMCLWSFHSHFALRRTVRPTIFTLHGCPNVLQILYYPSYVLDG